MESFRTVPGDSTHKDIEKFSNWIWEQMDESDSYDAVSAWLKENNVAGDDPAVACTTLLEGIMLEISKQQETDAASHRGRFLLTPPFSCA